MTLLCDLLPLRVGQEYLVAVMARLAHVRLVKGGLFWAYYLVISPHYLCRCVRSERIKGWIKMDVMFWAAYLVAGIGFTCALIEADSVRNIYRLLYVIIFFPFWLLWMSGLLLTIFVVWLAKKS